MPARNRQYHFIIRLLCLALALHFLNFSIDSKDAYPNSISENLAVNDIESISELVIEVVFGKSNAFREYDESDDCEGGSINFYKYYCASTVTSSSGQIHYLFTCSNFQILNQQMVLTPSLNISSPPPKG